MQIDEHSVLAVPRDLGMLAGNTSIREAEVGSGAAADDVRTMAHLKYARGAVLQQQGDGLFLGLVFAHGRAAQLSCSLWVDRGDGAGSGGELLSFRLRVVGGRGLCSLGFIIALRRGCVSVGIIGTVLEWDELRGAHGVLGESAGRLQLAGVERLHCLQVDANGTGEAPAVVTAVACHAVSQLIRQVGLGRRKVLVVGSADANAEIIGCQVLTVGVLHQEVFNFLLQAFF